MWALVHSSELEGHLDVLDVALGNQADQLAFVEGTGLVVVGNLDPEGDTIQEEHRKACLGSQGPAGSQEAQNVGHMEDSLGTEAVVEDILVEVVGDGVVAEAEIAVEVGRVVHEEYPGVVQAANRSICIN